MQRYLRSFHFFEVERKDYVVWMCIFLLMWFRRYRSLADKAGYCNGLNYLLNSCVCIYSNAKQTRKLCKLGFPSIHNFLFVLHSCIYKNNYLMRNLSAVSIIYYYRINISSRHLSAGKVPITQHALCLCIAILIRWSRNSFDRDSPVISSIFFAISATNLRPSSQIGPRVSVANGTKKWFSLSTISL